MQWQPTLNEVIYPKAVCAPLFYSSSSSDSLKPINLTISTFPVITATLYVPQKDFRQ